MPKRAREVTELIRNLIDGVAVGRAKRELVAAGGVAVVPVLEAATGRHGRMEPRRAGETLAGLVQVLERIAANDPKAVAGALAHDVPGVGLVAWSLGHSSSPSARRVLRTLLEHEDTGVRAVARYHLAAAQPRRKSPARKA